MDTPTIRPYAHEPGNRSFAIVVEHTEAGCTYVLDYDYKEDAPDIFRRWFSAGETLDLPARSLWPALRTALLAVGGSYPLPDGYTWKEEDGHWRVNPPVKPAGAPIPRETGGSW